MSAKPINGHVPVSIIDLEGELSLVTTKAEGIAGMLRSIARLTDDRDIKALCALGADLADEVSNDASFLGERALRAGFAKDAK